MNIRKDDSLEVKLIRVAMPLILYYGVQLIVQVGFGIYALKKEFSAIHNDEGANYQLAYRFFQSTELYIREHGLIVIFAAAVITIGILLVFLKRDTRERGKEWTGPKQMERKPFVLCILSGVFASAGLSRLINLFPIDNIIGNYEEVSKGFMANPLIFQILTLCIAAPVVEELIFRGIMYQRMKEYTDMLTAVMVQALIFGFYHGNLVQGLYAGLLGILLCLIFEKCDTLTAPVCIHMAANMTALAMMYLPVSEMINRHILSKIIVMALELLLLAAMIWYFFVREEGDKGEKNEGETSYAINMENIAVVHEKGKEEETNRKQRNREE